MYAERGKLQEKNQKELLEIKNWTWNEDGLQCAHQWTWHGQAENPWVGRQITEKYPKVKCKRKKGWRKKKRPKHSNPGKFQNVWYTGKKY